MCFSAITPLMFRGSGWANAAGISVISSVPMEESRGVHTTYLLIRMSHSRADKSAM